MSRDDLNPIIREAFGEPAEATDAQLLQDLQGQYPVDEVYAQFASLQADLKALADIPECQLTNERLKSAILSRGVKPKATLGWLRPALGMAATVAILASIWQINSLQPKVQPQQSEDVGGKLSPIGQGFAQKEGESDYAELLGNRVAEKTDQLHTALEQAEQDAGSALASQQTAPIRYSAKRVASRAVTRKASDIDQIAVVANLAVGSTLVGLDPSSAPAGMSTMALAGDQSANKTAMRGKQSSGDSVVVVQGSTAPGSSVNGAVEVKQDEVVYGG